MPKAKTAFVCQSCGTAHVRWQGRCEGCGEWNSIVEELLESGIGAGPKAALASGPAIALVPLNGETDPEILHLVQKQPKPSRLSY